MHKRKNRERKLSPLVEKQVNYFFKERSDAAKASETLCLWLNRQRQVDERTKNKNIEMARIRKLSPDTGKVSADRLTKGASMSKNEKMEISVSGIENLNK